MKSIFKKIALGLAFSPRVDALLAECARLKKKWGAELVLIHVGEHGTAEDEKLEELLFGVNLTRKEVKIFWERGKPEMRILEVCRKENVDLLVVGALKKENLVKYYLGTIARKILRRAQCSVLMMVNPSTKLRQLKNIVINAEDSPFVKEELKIACALGAEYADAWLHVIREVKLYSLTMTAADQYTEEEYEDLRQRLVQNEIEKVEQLLQDIPHEGLKINIKMLSGKSGFELSKFAIRKKADLLIVGASSKRLSFFDRMFPHDLEYIFADLPCNLLLVNKRKKAKNG
jgi:nucleotide-binding universal stress UspA family protein